MQDTAFIESTYDAIVDRQLRSQNRDQARQDTQEYFDAKITGLDPTGKRYTVRVNGGTATAISTSNTSFRTGQVASLYWPQGAGHGYLSKKPRG